MTKSVEIVEYFEELMTKKISEENKTPTIFRFNRKGYIFRTELVFAKQFLREADEDIDLLKMAIKILSQNPKYSWRIKGSLLDIRPFLNTGLSIAKSAIDKSKKEEQRAKQFDDILREREKIFNG